MGTCQEQGEIVIYGLAKYIRAEKVVVETKRNGRLLSLPSEALLIATAPITSTLFLELDLRLPWPRVWAPFTMKNPPFASLNPTSTLT